MLPFRSAFPRLRQVRTGHCPLLYFNLDLTKGQPEQVNTQLFSIQIQIQTNVDPNKGQSEQVKIQIKSFHRSVLCGPGHKSIRPHQPNQLGLGFKWVIRPQVIDCTRNWQFYKQMEVGGFLQGKCVDGVCRDVPCFRVPPRVGKKRLNPVGKNIPCLKPFTAV